MLQYVQEKIKLYQGTGDGDYSRISSSSQKTHSRNSRSSTAYQKNEDAILNEAQKIPTKEFITNLSLPHFPWSYSYIVKEFDANWNELEKITYYDDEPTYKYLTKDKKTVPNNQVIQISLKVLLCPVCSSMFHNASNAASKIYEYKQNQMDDYD
jgi:hypothetical protein